MIILALSKAGHTCLLTAPPAQNWHFHYFYYDEYYQYLKHVLSSSLWRITMITIVLMKEKQNLRIFSQTNYYQVNAKTLKQK